MAPDKDSTKRFSNRVQFYINHRPGYPDRLLQILKKECGLSSEHLIADIGSGTGFLSRLFLNNGNRVFAVEPNEAMRQAAERQFSGETNFMSIKGSAETTTLEDKSVDFITAGQAFHWFDVPRSHLEFTRILRDKGWVVLVWNDRKIETTPFLVAYENFLHQYGTDYDQVQHKTFDQKRIHDFFAPGGFNYRELGNFQIFDFEGLKGRVLSSSYIPARDHPQYGVMLNALENLYDEFQQDGEVCFEYRTKIFFGHLC